MKQKKPFKLGATYKLKKSCFDSFRFTVQLRQVYGYGIFKFTVTKIDTDGDVWDNNILVALSKERHLFKRVDNK